MGHSMGGIVATSLLPSSNISAVITMSMPHQLPPARFDRRIASIYNNNHAALAATNTPILSLCGGATDLMVPSELCILHEVPDVGVYRRTVFSSALGGCWTGVGHQVVAWCHQVRWRVARAVLELSVASSSVKRGAVLDRWLRDGSSRLPVIESPAPLDLNQTSSYTVLPPGPSCCRLCGRRLRTSCRPQRRVQQRGLQLIFQKARFFPWDPTVRTPTICNHYHADESA